MDSNTETSNTPEETLAVEQVLSEVHTGPTEQIRKTIADIDPSLFPFGDAAIDALEG